MRGRGNAIPTIVVTAEKDAAVIDRARRAGAYTVLKKPVDDSLLASIDAVFAQR
jgi:FixJ family two-component response regulator